MAGGLQGVVSRGERIARQRGQRVHSGHVLLAMLDHAQAGALLSTHGVQKGYLLDALGRHVEEPSNVMPLALQRARRLAGEAMSPAPGALHLLVSLLREQRSAAARCLSEIGSQAALEREALGLIGSPSPLRAARGVAAARATAQRDSGAQVPAARKHLQRAATAHGLQQRLAEQTEKGKRARKAGPGSLSSEAIAPAASLPLAEASGLASASGEAAVLPRLRLCPEPQADAQGLDPERFPLLSKLGRDLCAAAAAGQIDPVVGRDDEIEQLLDVLARRRAKNPVLVGPPGVGKTAIVEGLALSLQQGEGGLGERLLVELPASALVAGTGVRGALSERLQALCEELERADGRVIVFIDEIHSVLGNDDGADSIANGLKAALSRGGISCIGATTDAEYRRIFERDAALCRRFTPVAVDEPSPEAAAEILRGAAVEYEKHHGVAYAPEALEAAIELSVRFMPERRLPDKAIALIDQAAARVRRRGGTVAERESVAEVVSELSGVPLERLMMRDGDALLCLEEHLAERVVGQSRAIASIADALRKSAAGFRGARPLGTFLLLGPTGVGKTEMAKAISELLFPGCEMTRFDMSELSEAHAVARLLGAPPGYIGHEDGGQLTEAVRKRPYQLILLDEVEKAHREVLLSLLPLLDEGRLTDARGRSVDFCNTVVVMTSNLGAEVSSRATRIGFAATESGGHDALAAGALAAARKALPAELWNRIEEPLYFAPLSRKDVGLIADRLLEQAAAVLYEQYGVEVRHEPSAIEVLIDAGGYDPELGARPMRRTVGRLVEAALARAVLGDELVRGDVVTLRGQGGEIVF